MVGGAYTTYGEGPAQPGAPAFFGRDGTWTRDST